MQRRLIIAAALLSAAASSFVACSDDETLAPLPISSAGGDGGAAGDMGGGGMGGAGGESLWQPCSLITGENDGAAECAKFAMPAVRSDPSTGDIDVWVKRVHAPSAKRGGLWLLQGGPGGSVLSYESFIAVFQQMAPDLDIYMIEHRGVGNSDGLFCPVEEGINSDGAYAVTLAEMPACITHLQNTWGDKLPGFNGTEAAADLGEIIEMVSETGDETFVLGVSYGTQWAHRYTQLFPDQATGVIIDSICVPDCDFANLDPWLNDVAQLYLNACGSDTFCSSKLTNDPWTVAGQAWASFSSCTGFDPRLTPEVLKRLMANAMYNMFDRVLVPALFYRMNRCSSADINAFDQLAAVIFAPPQEPLPPVQAASSQLLQYNVGLIDNWSDTPPDLATLQSELDGLYLGLGIGVRFRQVMDVWPAHDKDQYHGQFSSYAKPLLMQQGGLDFIPQSAVLPVTAQFDGPAQSYALYPDTPHGTLLQTPLPQGDCSGRVLAQFLTGPTDAIDLSCIADILSLDFTVPSPLSTTAFGTGDAYEGDPGPVNVNANVMAARLATIPSFAQAVWRTRTGMVW